LFISVEIKRQVHLQMQAFSSHGKKKKKGKKGNKTTKIASWSLGSSTNKHENWKAMRLKTTV